MDKTNIEELNESIARFSSSLCAAFASLEESVAQTFREFGQALSLLQPAEEQIKKKERKRRHYFRMVERRKHESRYAKRCK